MEKMSQLESFLEKNNLVLNEQQQAAARRVEGQTLLLAVPGSGKTTVIICRLGYMIAELGIDPGSVLTLTFSRAGAGDLGERYRSFFGDTKQKPRFSTIHSFSLSVIRFYEKAFDRRAFDVLSDSGKLLSRIYFDIYHTAISDSDMSDLQSAVTLVKNRMLSRKEIEEMKVGDMDFIKLYDAYESYKLENHLMDFDDMLIYALKLLRKYPKLLKHFTDRYHYINVDEAQDTSTVQFAIIYLLAGAHGNLFMVGDEDQSIYGFRGAYPEELLHFKKRFPKGRVLLMETNHRSTGELVAASDHFITLNQERYEKHMITPNPGGVKPVHQYVKSVEEQYAFLLSAVTMERKNTAILYRNNESAIPLVDLFERKGIRYRIKEHNPLFFSHFIVRDILDFFEFAAHPDSIDVFSEIYYKMDCGISKKMMNSVKYKAADQSVFDYLLNLENLPEWQAGKIAKRSRGFERLKKMKPAQGIDWILDGLGYQKHLDFRIEHGYRAENIQQKLNILKIIARRAASQKDFIERLGELGGILRDEDSHNKGNITLSTIHSSKGLEFDKVYIIDAVEGEFPSMAALDDSEEGKRLFNEEVRLFYVGATRAKKELEFISVKGPDAPAVSEFIRFYMKEKEPEKKKVKKLREPNIGRLGADFMKKYKRQKSKSRKKEKIPWKAGEWVVHSKFGRGKLLAVKGQIGVIEFDSAGKKRLDLGICIENNTLKRASDI